MTGSLSLGGGETSTKTQVIADAKSGANTAESVNLEGIKVRVFGDAVIVTGPCHREEPVPRSRPERALYMDRSVGEEEWPLAGSCQSNQSRGRTEIMTL